MQAVVANRDAKHQCGKEKHPNRSPRARASHLLHGLAARGSLGRMSRARNVYKDGRAAASDKLPLGPPGLDEHAWQIQAKLGAAPPDRPKQSWCAGFQPTAIRRRWRRPCRAVQAAPRCDEPRATIAKSLPQPVALLAVRQRTRTDCKAGPTNPPATPGWSCRRLETKLLADRNQAAIPVRQPAPALSTMQD